MFGWFGKKKQKPTADPTPSDEFAKKCLGAVQGSAHSGTSGGQSQGIQGRPRLNPQLEASPAFQLQRKYWTFDQAEMDSLAARRPADLDFPTLLRLHHLYCMEIFRQHGDEATDVELSSAHRDVVGLLFGANGKCRSRHCVLGMGQAGKVQKEHQGLLSNASVTHLGCLEVIRLGPSNEPKELAFVPLDDIRGAIFAAPSLFRGAKLFYDDGRPDEIVSVPLLYGLSWQTSNDFDHDGTMTRFCCHLEVEGQVQRSGIGLGQQDVAIQSEKGGATLMGLGAVGEIMVALEMTDARFETKCRARGLNPEVIRRDMKEPQTDTSSQPTFKMTSATLYQPDSVLRQRLGNVEQLSSYLKAIQAAAVQFWESHPIERPAAGAIVVAIKPPNRSRCWLDLEVERRETLQASLNQALSSIEPPQVKAGPVAVAINFVLGNASPLPTAAANYSPPMPKEWKDAAKSLPAPGVMPDCILDIIWKD